MAVVYQYGRHRVSDDPTLQQWWGRFERLGATPSAALAVVQMAFQIDITDILSSVHVPTLIIHCTGGTLINVDCGRFLAQHIPGTRLIELPGEDHLFFVHEKIGDCIENSLPDLSLWQKATASLRPFCSQTLWTRPRGPWPNLLDAHHATVRRELARYRGGEIKSLGDGFLATFDGPARAIRCACAISEAVRELDIQVRRGLHTGEIETSGDDVQGIAVHIASRVSALAEAGEILVSRTVKDLVAGSGLHFKGRGKHSLKGLQKPMELHAASH